jgi:hypothetical protein
MKKHFNTHKRVLSIETLLKRVSTGSFTFLPKDKVASQEKATTAVGLILADLFTPTGLVLEDINGKYQIACNGKELYSLIQFINGEYPLLNTPLVHGVNGLTFNQLSNQAQNILMEKQAVFSSCLTEQVPQPEINTLIENYKSMYS